MSSAQNVMLRASIVLGMVAAVVTILYFSPLPDQNFKSCDRPCGDMDWPMICRVKLTVEMYHAMNGFCKDCSQNNLTLCNDKYCSNSDGSLRGVITANRQLPGPSIQVCQNDVLIVDIINKIPGHSLAVHWRGQPNNEAPFMDGVPMITQCPISGFTTFQYRFRASAAGTHFYHSHDDSDRADGFFGALIVRQPGKSEPHKRLYDIDDKEHVMLLSEWSDDFTSEYNENRKPKNILINGRALSDAGKGPAQFIITKKKRYRFRIAYTSGSSSCPITLAIDKHLMKIIALDGKPTSPYEASSITLAKGERVDFVLKSNQKINSYFVRVNSNCDGNKIEGLGLLTYEGVEAIDLTNNFIKQMEEEQQIRNFDTDLCNTGIGKVCLGDVKALNKIPRELQEEEVVQKIYLGYDFVSSNTSEYTSMRSETYRINNMTFTYPPSPILTQPRDVPLSITCNEFKIPEKCDNNASIICECVHIEHISLGSTVELVLFDKAGNDDENIFHLHGYYFYVVGYQTFDEIMTYDRIKELDYKGELFKRNLKTPVLKDTIRIPKNGVVALRFIANNPGVWMLRDEKSRGWTRGMDMVLQVGDSNNMVSTPTSFPTCGSYVGPEFLLI